MRAKVPLKILIAMLVLLTGLSLAGYDWKYLRQRVLAGCRATVEKVELEPRIALLEGTIETSVVLGVSNPYPVPLTLAGAELTLFAGKSEVGRAGLEPGESRRIPAFGRTTVPVRARVRLEEALPEFMSALGNYLGELKLKELGSAARNLGSGGMAAALEKVPVEFRIEGEVMLDTPIGSGLRLPLKAARRASAASASTERSPDVRTW